MRASAPSRTPRTAPTKPPRARTAPAPIHPSTTQATPHTRTTQSCHSSIHHTRPDPQTLLQDHQRPPTNKTPPPPPTATRPPPPQRALPPPKTQPPPQARRQTGQTQPTRHTPTHTYEPHANTGRTQ